MKHCLTVILALLLLLMSVSLVFADDYKYIHATLTAQRFSAGSYGENLYSESGRCLATACAIRDLQQDEPSFSVAKNYTFFGKDREGDLYYIGLGGGDTSRILMYMPSKYPDLYILVPFGLGSVWLESMISTFCSVYYRNSEVALTSAISSLY